MKMPRGFFSSKLIISLLIVLGILVLGRLSLPGLGRFLVAQDQPQPSDIIVVLMGSGPDRMLGAVDLYQAGYADKIVMVRNNVGGYDLVVSKGVKIPHDTDVAQMVAVQLGVPQDNVLILPGDALSTQDEARRVREYLRDKQDIDLMILVTSKYHSGRAKKIFVRAMSSMDREIRVISCPSQYDDFKLERWWQSREDLKRGVLEYMKLLEFYGYEQFEL
ncbi:MAG: YdcF family protein [Syntrophomonas sp.]|nr:YdcF family protein [Syntrophomonas sp.]